MNHYVLLEMFKILTLIMRNKKITLDTNTYKFVLPPRGQLGHYIKSLKQNRLFVIYTLKCPQLAINEVLSYVN
jgi:hypothetical protein